ncbi:SMI1/KNR4 family protein [Actinocorallia libanotica]|uniref:Knr4/Smi1-like domain-containing protein n=1 Tax=Actinocorallia libanotica TaxID=46162 RepID=A0ABP4CAS6_9ACTN
MSAPFEELRELAEAVREARGWARTGLEIVCRPSGAYGFTAFTDAVTSLRGRGGGFQAVLDSDHRLPEPGFTQEGGTAAPAGDPVLAVARFQEYLRRRADILGRAETLPPPASAAAIEETEHRIGHRLPEDLRALYALADGDAHLYLFGGASWLPLKSLASVHTDLSVPYPPTWELARDRVVFDADPPETVRRCSGHPGWLPFGTGEDGNYLAVDLAPARDGRPGQVIRTGRDHDEGPARIADSVTSLLGRYLELLDRGCYEKDDGHLFLDDPERPSGPETIVGEFPDTVPPDLQALHVNDAPGTVDLAPLTAAPRLRRLHLNRCATTDLAPLARQPVESLRVTLHGGGLTPLQGHHHLASLDLATASPIDIAPLRTAPNLRCLDLSHAEVHDLTVLADLHELRYLSLTAHQWNTLFNAAELPPALAAARLADDHAPLSEALAWAAHLGLDTTAALHTTGAL